MTDLPTPPIPADADVSDFPFTPLYRHRLFGSAFHAKATDAEWRAGVTLWLKSQDQFPSGSLPDDDTELCRLAELGRDLKAWRKIRAGALRGWEPHADGRLYHGVVAEIVTEQWNGKKEQRARTARARIAKLEKRLSQTKDPVAKTEMQRQLQELRQSLSDVSTETVTDSVTDDVTGSKGKGEGQGKGDSNTPTPSAPVCTPAASEPPVADPPKPSGRARLPADWTLPDDWRAWATDELLSLGGGLPAIMTWIGRAAIRFRDHALAEGKAKADWEAQWRLWISTDIEQGKAPGAAPGGANEQAGEAEARGRSDRIAAAVARVQGGAAAVLGRGAERDADPALPAVPGE